MLSTSRPKHHHVMMKRTTDALHKLPSLNSDIKRTKHNLVVLILQRNLEHQSYPLIISIFEMSMNQMLQAEK